jgi:hypothetical protein
MHLRRNYFAHLVLLAPLVWPLFIGQLSLSSCALQTDLQTQVIGDLGRFEFRPPSQSMEGAMISAPHGAEEPFAADYAKWISQRTGAGLAIAYGFHARRIFVSQPLISATLNLNSAADPVRRGSVYQEFKKLLLNVTNGNLNFYAGIRFAGSGVHANTMEVTATGFTIEEVKLLKDRFARLRDQALQNTAAPKIALAIDPVDRLSWQVFAVKHHGVLMGAEKGLSLKLPSSLATADAEKIYRDVLAAWVESARALAGQTNPPAPQMRVWRGQYGRIELISSRKNIRGIVVGAPHGSFDKFTAELVKQIAYGTGQAAVIAEGFSPTETGGGWRINVNRPSENRYPTGDLERPTERARAVYEVFKESVNMAAQGPLNLYLDIHQTDGINEINVATVNVSKQQARMIKETYRALRDRLACDHPRIPQVDMSIEPVDEVEIGAWAAKTNGILSVAKRSLHFELPIAFALQTAGMRAFYTQVLTQLAGHVPDILRAPLDRPAFVQTNLRQSDAARSFAAKSR